MFQVQVTLYINTVSQYYSHSTFHIPHSTITRLLRNLDVLYKVTLAVGFCTIDHEMTA